VFIHAISGGASSYHWRRVAPAFAADHRVVALDLIGWGASDHPVYQQGVEDYVRQITEALEALQPHGRPIVVAESLSGSFAAEVANRRPDLVAGLVLLTPTGARDFGEDQFKLPIRLTLGVLAATPVVNRAVYRAVFHRRATYQRYWEGPAGYETPQEVEADLVEATWWSGTRDGAAWSALPFLSGRIRHDAAPVLGRLTVPTAAIWGTMARLKALMPKAQHRDVALSRGYFLIAKPAESIASIRELIGQLAT
jgi:pimeloyl-ACP methyl ester carboxylesterase